MTELPSVNVAIIGSGNIGTDLMLKICNDPGSLKMAALVGIDPSSEGLQRARDKGVRAMAGGMAELVGSDIWPEIDIVFDATSAGAHAEHAAACADANKFMIDLTPAAIGPYFVPVLADELPSGGNVNMVTCGGQATIPIVAAIASVAPVTYAEIVASISSKSAGPGTRANIDEFTETTSNALCTVGGAAHGKAIIILNPAEPPLLMRDTVYCLTEGGDPDAIRAAVEAMVARVQEYVPGYRLKQAVQVEHIGSNAPLFVPDLGREVSGLKTTVFLEVEGAGDFLPVYAGNLDIMTAAAKRTAERAAAMLRTRNQVSAGLAQ